MSTSLDPSHALPAVADARSIAQIRRMTSGVDRAGENWLAAQATQDGDARLVAALAAEGFAGPLSRRVETELARYGLAALTSWLRTGYVFSLAGKAGRPLHPRPADLDDLRRDADQRLSLAGSVVAVTLPRFWQEALVGGGWRDTGGARLTTYFVGAALHHFPNEYRRYEAERARWRRGELARFFAAAEPPAPDPADEVAARDALDAHLATLTPRVATIVQLHLDGYTYAEIAELASASSERAVEGVLHRWRGAELRRRGGGRDAG